ncbi:acyl carrier protein [Amycolatopsis sp. PS_44_ISF1]|uniref:acyl carrier protein n=1 Tax=Amycolatopsis sp. PS_44_ISF1 TaxID=2974917 RepID=UPI0028DEFBF9|nr:acyl carrier protein [Amycolatopsis sp. PS_44_ISF1]MDT8913699.1 acyl carrier protein [Amycolatopsis sp. PS_44_ISF1]
MTEEDRRHLDFITSYLADTFGVERKTLNPDRTFASLDLDSIAQVELFVTLAEHYGVHMDDARAHGGLTLAETAHMVTTAPKPPANTPHDNAPRIQS